MADALVKYETIDSDQIDDIMSGKTPRTPKGWDDDDDAEGKEAKPGNDASGKKSAPPGEPPVGEPT